MFTGIIQGIGHIERIKTQNGDLCLRIAAGTLDLQQVRVGDSIATSGVCLTVVAHGSATFDTQVSQETLACTVGLDARRPVNLERALRLADRLDGHLVSGHVDGVGQVVRFEPAGGCVLLSVRAPHLLLRYLAPKGSIAIDGVSLTINAVEEDTLSVNLIPHTLHTTTLGNLGIGSRVNLEVDLVARYVERMLQPDRDKEPA